MGDEERSSFHGSLSRFAYVPPSSSSSSSTSSSPRRHDQASNRTAWLSQAASTTCSIEEGDNSSSNRSSALSVTSSLKRGGAERRSTDARSRKRQYATPDVNSHLSGIPDHVAEDLDVLFCGINPGHMSAVTGHHYANPTNHFWHCLHHSGFTPRLLLPSEDCTLPERYNLGLTNLVERPSTSEAELSVQEMADSVPALLTKIARLRPRVTCFVGKGIWLHVERALRSLKGDAAGDKNAGSREDPTQAPLLGARAPGHHVVEAVKPAVAPKDERSAYFHLVGDTVRLEQRQLKAEPEPLDFCGVVRLEESGSEVSTKQNTISEVEETVNDTPMPSLSLPRRGGGSRASAPRPASKKAKALPAPAFAYGLQPFKAVHNAVPHSASVGETLFCVFPSTSGRVVSHQRDDKVALYKVLRENLERVKAGILDTSSMPIIHLRADSH